MINLEHKYFLLDNGTVLYAPSGINKKFTKQTEEVGIKVALYKSSSVRKGFFGGIGLLWLGIVFSTNSLEELEDAEEEYFYRNPSLVNYFFTSLTNKKHTLPINKWSVTPSKHIEALRNLNRISLIDQMIRLGEEQ